MDVFALTPDEMTAADRLFAELLAEREDALADLAAFRRDDDPPAEGVPLVARG